MPKIYDNSGNTLKDGLIEAINQSKRTDFCIGYFNLRGWRIVADKIDNLSGDLIFENDEECHRTCRLLVGMQKMPIDLIKEYFARDENFIVDQREVNKLKKQLAKEFKEQLSVGYPTEADELALRKLCRQLKSKKVVVKLHARYPLHAKLYLTYSSDSIVPVIGFLGSSNLTLAGLELQGELNIDVLEQDAANKLAVWFDERWNDRFSIDISKELIEIIEASWASETPIPPYYIYLKIAYHLSKEALAGLSQYQIPRIFNNDLFEFQKAAVLIAAKKLDSRGGVMIGDVVGLGKTITACALAKTFEERDLSSTLIICPPNLISMWQGYKDKYDMKADMISIGAVQNELKNLKRYKIVIIDESHNLRNDRGSRYLAIKEYLDLNECKVILLTATPYNKSFLDLSNQLRLFIPDDKDLGVMPDHYISSIGGQIKFNAKHTETFIRSIKAFERSSFSEDWQELMRYFLVRRTRCFIKNNYADLDERDGRKYLTFSNGERSYFPDRIPKKVEYHFDPEDPTDLYAKLYSQEIVDKITELELARYGLQNFLKEEAISRATGKDKQIIENLSHAGKRLMGFCRTNLYKRLESSGYSFLLSLSRHILRNYIFIYALEHNLPIPLGKNVSTNLDDFLDDEDIDGDGDDNTLSLILRPELYLKKAEEVYSLFKDQYEKRFDWIRSELFESTLKESLTNDALSIIEILNLGKDWNPDNDRQLNALYQLLTETHEKEKVLIFTQFSDTAHYLVEQLKKRGLAKTEVVTGGDKNPTEKAHRFSPISNGKPNINHNNEDIRILIATDVLSEGQNLQDARIILNYDLPWAIIRLIQRAGRVDRIGQKAKEILCYSFLPEDGIEKIIKLRSRLSQRIEDNANVIGSSETFFEGDPINLTDIYNEKSGVLDEDDKDTEIDLSSYAYQIWKNAIDADPKLQKIIPDLEHVVYSTKENNSIQDKEGVIVYSLSDSSNNENENDLLAWLDDDGRVITQSQFTILEAAACEPTTIAEPKLKNHHSLVKKAMDVLKVEENNRGTSLGRRSGIKYQVYVRLEAYCKNNEGSPFVNGLLKKAVDDILNYPLKDVAKDIIGRQFRSGISDKELAELVISLKQEDKLTRSEEEHGTIKLPQIICSLGLINK